MNWKEELNKLVTLSGCDTEIQDIRRHVDGRKLQLKKDDERLKLAREQLAQKKDDLRKKKMESDRVDVDVKSLEMRYKECNCHLMKLKDEKSYDAMKLQLQDVKENIESREAAGIEILREMEELEKTVNLYQEKISAEENRLAVLRDEIKAEEEKCKPGLEALELKRKSCAMSVDPDCMSVYERLRKLPNKRAMAELEGRTCLGCYSEATPDVTDKVKLKEKLVCCSSCGRILFVPAAAEKKN